MRNIPLEFSSIVSSLKMCKEKSSTHRYLGELSVSKELKGESYLSNFQSNRSFTRDVYIKGEREGRGKGQPILRLKGCIDSFRFLLTREEVDDKTDTRYFYRTFPSNAYIYLPLFDSFSNWFHAYDAFSLDRPTLIRSLPTSFANRSMDRVTRVYEERNKRETRS